VQPADFYVSLNAYISESPLGESEANSFKIGLDQDGQMKFMVITCTAVGNPSSVYDKKIGIWNDFTDLSDEWNGKAEDKEF